MDFQELIMARRSVRAYESAPGRGALEEILREAQRAPSWKNGQPSRCYVVETPETLEDFRAAALPSFNQNSSANAVLIVTTCVIPIVVLLVFFWLVKTALNADMNLRLPVPGRRRLR